MSAARKQREGSQLRCVDHEGQPEEHAAGANRARAGIESRSAVPPEEREPETVERDREDDDIGREDQSQRKQDSERTAESKPFQRSISSREEKRGHEGDPFGEQADRTEHARMGVRVEGLETEIERAVVDELCKAGRDRESQCCPNCVRDDPLLPQVAARNGWPGTSVVN